MCSNKSTALLNHAHQFRVVVEHNIGQQCKRELRVETTHVNFAVNTSRFLCAADMHLDDQVGTFSHGHVHIRLDGA